MLQSFSANQSPNSSDSENSFISDKTEVSKPDTIQLWSKDLKFDNFKHILLLPKTLKVINFYNLVNQVS
jgi:hypothetical protein